MTRTLALLALAVVQCNAGILYVEFTSGAAQTGPAALPGGPNATWNTFSQNPNGSNLAVTDTSGDSTGVLLSYTSSQNYTGGCCGYFGPAYNDLADGYLSQHSGTGTVTLSGLPVATNFTLYLYSERDCGCSSGVFSVNGSANQYTATGTPSAFVLNENYLVFNGAANANGDVVISYGPNGAGEGEINGLQLEYAPEPGGAFLAFGGMALLCAARFKRAPARAVR
jgi:hypothetical protein